MLDKSTTYLLVGLGLLGGRYAQVLSSHGYHVTGIARSRETIDYALQHEYIAEGATENFDALVTGADCIIFGLYPTVLLEWVKQYGHLIQPGTMVTDVSGVKRGVVEPVQAALPEGAEFIASHPMAGRETSGASLCYLTPSHHFPTGVTMPATRRAQLLAWAAEKPGRYILEDDYDSEFRFDTRPLPCLQGMAGADGPVVYLTTFSKSLAPGIRIACMVLPQSLLRRYRRDFAAYANTVSRFEQQTLCEFMAGGYFTRHLARMRLAYKRRMETFAAALRAALPGVELDGVHSGLHFLLTLPQAESEAAMVQAAAQHGVRLRGLSEYYMARPELCRPNTVVAGYSALKEDDIPAVAAALAGAWCSFL